MPALQALYARYRNPVGVLASAPHAPSDTARRAVREALAGLESALTISCLASPDKLTEDGVHAYALALMQLRETAVAAGCRRLVAACDALSVTVSRLIENRAGCRRDQCDALARFVAHARAMVEMEAGERVPDVCLLADRLVAAHTGTLQ
ncbi:MAG: hypothetical protein AB1593_04305 [Pseudomonadota bacterium]